MKAEDAIEVLENAGFSLNRIFEGSGRIVVLNTPRMGVTHMVITTSGEVNDKQVKWYLNRAPKTSTLDD